MLVINGVTRAFTRVAVRTFPRLRRVTALSNVSFSADRGQILGIVGPGRAGKTTLARIVCGLIPADRGEISIAGVRVTPGRPGLVSTVAGVIEGVTAWSPWLTVHENLEYHCSLAGMNRQLAADTVDKLVDLLSLAFVRHRVVAHVPGYARTRLSLGIALASDPEVLVLDELTAGLTAQEETALLSIVSALAGTRLVLLFTSSDEVAGALCSRVVVLRRGQVVQQGLAREILAARHSVQYLLTVAHRSSEGLGRFLGDVRQCFPDVFSRRDGDRARLAVSADYPGLVYGLIDLAREHDCVLLGVSRSGRSLMTGRNEGRRGERVIWTS